jgi:hypothetical protein
MLASPDKYLHVHQGWVPPTNDTEPTDTFRHSITDNEFDAEALRLLKMARAALIHLSLSVRREEVLRNEGRDDRLVFSVPLHA